MRAMGPGAASLQRRRPCRGPAELAPDVRMLNPGTNDAIIGRDDVVAALRAVEAACDQFRHTHLLVDPAPGKHPLFAMVFEAQIGEKTAARCRPGRGR